MLGVFFINQCKVVALHYNSHIPHPPHPHILQGRSGSGVTTEKSLRTFISNCVGSGRASNERGFRKLVISKCTQGVFLANILRYFRHESQKDLSSDMTSHQCPTHWSVYNQCYCWHQKNQEVHLIRAGFLTWAEFWVKMSYPDVAGAYAVYGIINYT